MTNEELIKAARERVEHAAQGTPSGQAARIRGGKSDDDQLRLIVHLADALEAAGAPHRGGGVNLFRDLGYDESAPAVVAARAGAKLAELIDELRASADEGSYDTAELCRRAADALEAAGNAIEWEYGTGHVADPDIGAPEPNRRAAEARAAAWNSTTRTQTGVVLRRRKAGPWLPVEGENNGDS